MHVYLQGGPRNGTTVEVQAGRTEYLVPLPKPITSIKESLQYAANPGDLKPNYDVARYRNTYRATVDSMGRVGCVIFEYTGTEKF